MSDEGKTEGKGRPVQPKCEHCGKALYKRMDPGGVKTADPYAWCRNASCEAYNTDQSGDSRFAPIGGAAPAKKAVAKPASGGTSAPKVAPPPPAKPAPKPDKAVAKKRAAQDAAEAAAVAEAAAAAVGAKADAASDDGELDVVAKARKRIQLALDAVEKTYSKAVIGLALAIVSQQMGNNEAANALIAEYNLEELYGIQPR